MKVLLGVTGSVATIKTDQVVKELKQIADGVQVKIIATENARHFLQGLRIPDADDIYADADEWEAWSKRGDPVLHVDLAKWADVFIVAPLDALTLSKLTRGHCDNLLTCVALAWPRDKPIIVCPAMNTHMWLNPTVRENMQRFVNLCVNGYVIAPISKRLMCGDVGEGGMQEPDKIAQEVKKIVINHSRPPNVGEKVVRAAGVFACVGFVIFAVLFRR